MGVGAETILAAKAQLCEQIDRISVEMSGFTTRQMAFQIDDIRRMARDCGMFPVEELARSLERALSGGQSCAVANPFLHSMREALSGERIDAAAAQSYLAAVNQRLYG